MISSADFIKQSLGLNLFFARIMKEHALFIQVAFTPRDVNFIQRADAFRREFDSILRETISLADGIINCEVLKSGEITTPFTLNAEMATAFFTGIQIPTQLTQAEAGLACGNIIKNNPTLEQRISALNNRAINATAPLIQFQYNVLNNVLSCRMFTLNYPSLILHVTREAELYLMQLKKLQNREKVESEKELVELELFWGRQMVEHMEFIRGLLDPTEKDLINQTNNLINQFSNFGNEFNQLLEMAKASLDATTPQTKVNNSKFRVAEEIRNFQAEATRGILACEIKSIILPLLGDHVLRESNHYLRLLSISKTH